MVIAQDFIQKNWTEYYYCNQEGIHFHCSKHSEIESEDNDSNSSYTYELICPKCKKPRRFLKQWLKSNSVDCSYDENGDFDIDYEIVEI